MTLDARIAPNVNQEAGHWLWTGTTNYGKPWGAPKLGRESVRDIVWREYKGEIPAGHHIVSICPKRQCVHPEHLGAKLNDTATPAGERSSIELLVGIDNKLSRIMSHLGLDPFE